jgi:hypothetical protein
MMTWILIGGLAAIALLVGLAIYAAYRAGREDGYEEGRGDAYEEIRDRHETEPIASMRAGRHAKNQPRADLPLQPAAVTPDPSRTSLVQFWPRQAFSSKHGAADTGTMPRVRLPADVTDTGELRAIEAWGDEMATQIERGELV